MSASGQLLLRSASVGLLVSAACALVGAATADGDARVLERDGIRVEVAALPHRTRSDGPIMAGQHIEIGFTITDAEAGAALAGLYPSAWMDLTDPRSVAGDGVSCRDKLGQYLRGTLAFRPSIDLNSYFVLAMNRDASISVIDPILGMQGISQMHSVIVLRRAGADWVQDAAAGRLFVTMPRADAVAVIDTGELRVLDNVAAGPRPTRVALSPDRRYLWIGNDATHADDSGVTVIDAQTLDAVAFIATGAGRHELALSDDGRLVFVSNRDAGTVSIIDAGAFALRSAVDVGGRPVSMAWSEHAGALYVAGYESGIVTVIDGNSRTVRARVVLEPGLTALRFTPDGRHAFVLNGERDTVQIVDPARNRVIHTVPVAGRPDQVSFTDEFAYVRALDSEAVTLISLTELGRGAVPQVVARVAAGNAAPAAGDPGIAGSIVPGIESGAALIANPAEGIVYYYKQGMAQTMGGFRSHGHQIRGVTIVDRSLRERSPGRYTTSVRVPKAGRYDLAFLLESPRVYHCFTIDVADNPLLTSPDPQGVQIDYLIGARTVLSQSEMRLRFRVRDGDEPRAGVGDLEIHYFLAPGFDRRRIPVAEVGDGIYEGQLSLGRPGAYYVYIESRSLDFERKSPFITLRAVPRTQQGTPSTGGEG